MSLRNLRENLLPLCFGIVTFCAIPIAHAQDSTFENDVWPIFESRCFDCHAGEKAEASLRLDARNAFLHGGISGRPIDVESPTASLLLQRIDSDDPDVRMPPDDDPLTDREIAIIRDWIAAGGQWPEGIGESVIVETHWSYVAPSNADLPLVADQDWTRNPIDYFILAALESRDWTPSPAADDATLVRRVYLDLIGIPPTLDEIDAFLADRRPDRYERLVDALLASPRYGERWARPWLDAARYADSNGYQADQYREVWAYRDWVIRSMNSDMSFAQFTIDQLAGDLVAQPTLDQRIATGFHRLTTCNVEAGVDPEENRVNQIIDRVNTTATVWLGTTLECAQCHNHKYDPFTQKDYYSFFAFFNQTPIEVQDSGNTIQFEFVGPKMELPLTEEQQRIKASLVDDLAAAREELDSTADSRLAQLDEWIIQTLEEAATGADWQVLELVDFKSSGGSEATRLDDQSVLIGGPRPDKDDYVAIFRFAGTTEVRSLRLETLTHDSLPGKGPGRHDPERPNFVLYELEAALLDAAKIDSGTLDEGIFAPDATAFEDSISFASVEADFSQNNWNVSGIIDGDRTTGWGINPQFHRDHWAILALDNAIEASDSQLLALRFDQHYGGTRSIGRFRISVSNRQVSSVAIPDAVLATIQMDRADWNDAQRTLVTDYFLSTNSEIGQLHNRINALEDQIREIVSPTTLVMVEENQQRDTHVFVRGDFLSPAESVVADTPTVLHEQDSTLPQTRMGLAQWLVDKDNPLTARVIVNRWWAEFFGQGIVLTQEDFGVEGDRPTHPELLDWLAYQFMDREWSRKEIHRLIVTSATYRQSSRMTAEQLERDPSNRWLARGPRFRLAAETIRDSALVISGQLSRDMGGPPIYPPQPDGIWRHVGRNAPVYQTSTGNDRFRRGIYVVWRRSAPYPSFVNFDAPDRASCVISRSRTNTPMQALTLLNDPAYVELIDALAASLHANVDGRSVSSRLEEAFRRCTGRFPHDNERRLLQVMFERELSLRIDQLRESNPPNDNSQDPLGAAHRRQCELDTWRFISTVLFNLDETITRE